MRMEAGGVSSKVLSFPASRALIATVGLLVVASVRAEEPTDEPQIIASLDSGRAKAAACAECHGLDGNSDDERYPKLAGQYQMVIEKQLDDFRAGARTHKSMVEPLMDLDDQTRTDLAAWFAAQTRTPGSGNPLVALRGKRVYQEGRPEDDIPPCAACHGKRGQGFPGVFPGGLPLVGAQHAAYLRAQMSAFRADERKNDPHGVMRRAVADLSDQDIEGLAEYMAGLRPPVVGAAAE